jgi:hypothetical protein
LVFLAEIVVEVEKLLVRQLLFEASVQRSLNSMALDFAL